MRLIDSIDMTAQQVREWHDDLVAVLEATAHRAAAGGVSPSAARGQFDRILMRHLESFSDMVAAEMNFIVQEILSEHFDHFGDTLGSAALDRIGRHANEALGHVAVLVGAQLNAEAAQLRRLVALRALPVGTLAPAGAPDVIASIKRKIGSGPYHTGRDGRRNDPSLHIELSIRQALLLLRNEVELLSISAQGFDLVPVMKEEDGDEVEIAIIDMSLSGEGFWPQLGQGVQRISYSQALAEIFHPRSTAWLDHTRVGSVLDVPR